MYYIVQCALYRLSDNESENMGVVNELINFNAKKSLLSQSTTRTINNVLRNIMLYVPSSAAGTDRSITYWHWLFGIISTIHLSEQSQNKGVQIIEVPLY